jgi:hydrogenase expression/formation protein HypD
VTDSSFYRDARQVGRLVDLIRRTITRPWTLMEICGGQTHAILRAGLDQLLPPEIELLHGPGCPVCVTPLATIDRALALAARPDVILTSYGDMLRVPGSHGDLFSVRAAGGDVRVVYSPLDAVELARRTPAKQVIFLGIGFETTAPANAMSVLHAAALGLDNFSLLGSHVRVPPAIEAILSAPGRRVQGFLAAGHVCAVMGTWEYPPLAARHHVPIVVTGFEPLDLLTGILLTVRQLESGRATVENAYPRAVTEAGNLAAQAVIARAFESCDRDWRGIGPIPASGWRLRPEWAAFDADLRFPASAPSAPEPEICRAGEVLQGLCQPPDCAAFGTQCTPEHPLGATMVSAEGTCAAYYRYRPGSLNAAPPRRQVESR